MKKLNEDLMSGTQNKVLKIFCSDILYIDEAFRTLVKQFFNEETITALKAYGEVLKKIHNRLISEGYVIHNGEFYKQIDGKLRACDDNQN